MTFQQQPAPLQQITDNTTRITQQGAQNRPPGTLDKIVNAAAQTGRTLGGIVQGFTKTFAAPGIAMEALPQGVQDVLHINGRRSPSRQSDGSAVKQIPGMHESKPGDKPITKAAGFLNAETENRTNAWVPPAQTKAAEFVAKASDALGEAIPAAGLAVATGGLSASSVLAGNAASWVAGGANAFSTEMLEGSGNANRALLAGAVETGAEALGGKVFGTLADKTTNPVARFAADSFGEGVEEVISGATQAALTKEAYTSGQALEEFALGAAVGVALSGAIAAANKVGSAINMPATATKRVGGDNVRPVAKVTDTTKALGEKILFPAIREDVALLSVGNRANATLMRAGGNVFTIAPGLSSESLTLNALNGGALTNVSHGTWFSDTAPREYQAFPTIDTQGTAVVSSPETEPWKFSEPSPAIPFPTVVSEVTAQSATRAEPAVTTDTQVSTRVDTVLNIQPSAAHESGKAPQAELAANSSPAASPTALATSAQSETTAEPATRLVTESAVTVNAGISTATHESALPSESKNPESVASTSKSAATATETAEERAARIWMPAQAMEKASAAEQQNRRNKNNLPGYDSDLFRGLGSTGRVFESMGYKQTFGGLASY